MGENTAPEKGWPPRVVGFLRAQFLDGPPGETNSKGRLNLFDGNSAGFANFNAAFAAETFIGIYRN
jgi:hypothetical protein